MSWTADAALWTALILSGFATGLLVATWREPAVGASRLVDLLQLSAAGASVIAWSMHAGTLLAAGAPPAWLTASVPNEVSAGYRLAVLWAALPGAALTSGTLLLVAAALAAPASVALRGRFATVTSVLAFVALGLAVWFAPSANAAPSAVPPFVLSVAAAAAPLLALIALLLLGWCAAAVVADRSTAVPRLPLLVAWIAATGAVAAEQVARSQLGLGPRDAVVLGSASSGLVLWLAISALLHERVQRLGMRGETRAVASRSARIGRLAAHAGALVLAASFAAHIAATRATLSLPPGKVVEVSDAFGRPWRLANQGVSRFDADAVDVMSLVIETVSPSGKGSLVTPELREYHRRDGEHLPVGVGMRRSIRSPVQELRVLLVSADTSDIASVRVTFLPLPILWPAGLALMGLAVVLLASASGSHPDRGHG